MYKADRQNNKLKCTNFGEYYFLNIEMWVLYGIIVHFSLKLKIFPPYLNMNDCK